MIAIGGTEDPTAASRPRVQVTTRTGTHERPATTSSFTDALRYRSFDGSTAGPLARVSGTGIAWGSARGVFQVGPTLFWGTTDGTLDEARFDGTTVRGCRNCHRRML